MRKELVQKLLMPLISRDIDIKGLSEEFFIILNDYEISRRETAIALLQEDRNEMLINKFIIAKTVKGCTARSIDYYNTRLKYIISAIGKTVDDITADDIRLYLATRHVRDKISKVTQDNELRVLRTFFQYLYLEEYIPCDPTKKIDSIKAPKKKKKAFTELEVEKLRNACSTKREKALIETLLSTGCRVTELVTIKISDIENDKVVIHGKGEKDRTVYFNAKAYLALQEYMAERKDDNPYLFAGVKDNTSLGSLESKTWYLNLDIVDKNHHLSQCAVECVVRKMGEKMGIEAYPHKFRRTCATMALKRGMPIEQVSKMLGHEQLDTTKIYLDMTNEELEQAHRKYVV